MSLTILTPLDLHRACVYSHLANQDEELDRSADVDSVHSGKQQTPEKEVSIQNHSICWIYSSRISSCQSFVKVFLNVCDSAMLVYVLQLMGTAFAKCSRRIINLIMNLEVWEKQLTKS